MQLVNQADSTALLTPASLCEPAPAKINLDLHVVGQRLDGYHELDSLVVFSAFADRLECQVSDRFSLSIDGPFAAQTPIDDNIILKAAHLLKNEFPSIHPMAFKLSKNLPVASGIGGGSSDAAAALRLIVRANQIAIDDEGLRDIGAILGADVPVCLYGRSARMRGTGLRLDPIRALPELPLVLVNPGIRLATADVFRCRQGPFLPVDRSPLPANSSVTGFSVWLKSCRNDLETAARQIVPDIQDVMTSLYELDGALLVRMSGSGATCFAIFSDHKRADRAVARINHKHPDWWVIATKTLT